MSAASNNENLELLGVRVSRFDHERELIEALYKGAPICLAFANTNLLNFAYRDFDLRMKISNFMIVNDGIGVDLAARILGQKKFPVNLNGTDFIPKFLEDLAPSRLYLFGARPDVVKVTARAIAQLFPKHRVVGWQHGYISQDRANDLPDIIAAKHADVLLVALGSPEQERWLADNFSRTNCKFGLAVGAYFDFAANIIPRAPRIMRDLRLEWAYRLAREPRRLGKRYTIEIANFFWLVFKQRLMN